MPCCNLGREHLFAIDEGERSQVVAVEGGHGKSVSRLYGTWGSSPECADVDLHPCCSLGQRQAIEEIEKEEEEVEYSHICISYIILIPIIPMTFFWWSRSNQLDHITTYILCGPTNLLKIRYLLYQIICFNLFKYH
jgi:hypothetical protein